MNDLRSDPVWEKLRQALTGLPIKDAVDYLIPSFVDTLMILSRENIEVDRHYIHAGQKGAREDLDEILSAASLLTQAMRTVHYEVYDLLYDAGVKPYDIIELCSRLSQVCNALDLARLPKTKPRIETRVRADELANILAYQYEILVGERATIINREGAPASGRFLELVAEVFSAASIEGSPEGCADRALGKRRAANLASKTPFAADKPSP